MRRVLVTIACALVPLTASAQPPVQEAPTATPIPPWTGSFDFGVRGTSVGGDAARYERYRDLGDGLFLEGLGFNRTRNNWILQLTSEHVGRSDQRYAANAERLGTFNAWFVWDQIPMLLSRATRTLFSGVGTGELQISDALQAQVQAQPSAIGPLFSQFGQRFDTQTRRRIAEGGFKYLASPDLSISAKLRHTRREGTIPYGGSFGHSSLVELPAPTDHSLTAADAGAEFARDPVVLRAGYTGSWFHNDVTSVIFDNPFRAIDIAATPSRGRLTLPPSTSFMGVNGLASVRLPRRSRATAYVSVGMLADAGDPIVPLTINSAVATGPLARTTVEGEARTSAVNLTFVSRPTRFVDVTAGYRQYEYDNRTPAFAMRERVSYDNAVAAVDPAVLTEPFGVLRHTFDADVKLAPARGVSIGVGVTRLEEERTHRIFESTADNVVRLTGDAVSSRWFTLRTKYEHAERRGNGIEEGERELAAIGEQPGMRHFDIAARDRNRVTLLGSLTPAGNVGVSVSIAAGKDDYLQSLFGVRDNTHRIYGFGFDATPNNRVVLATSYSYERYTALSRSRQANPGAQFADASRNWATDAADRVHSVIVSADVLRVAPNVDLRLSYDFSRARARYDYVTGAVPDRTLPEEVVVPTTLPTPAELPPTLSELQRGTMDLTYALASHLSIGLSYWHERYRVHDFTLDVDANPDLARGQTLLMGYLYRPYTANTVWGRLIYHW
ncbi:MAG TPA: MtrB/PioB family outer membrane beta-barrel protein [Vicinamibacterales bacterium]|nr:MtrB/PioB family outer membrane beta-barrel protein [Vicinamibacterales bacterium]